MIRLRFTCVLLATLGLGCSQPSADPDATGGSATGGRIAPERSSGGNTGSGTGGGMAGAAGSGGAGDGSAGSGPSGGGTGGGGASGGTGAGDAAAAIDNPLVVDVPAGVSDAAASVSDGFRPIVPDAAPWQMMCPDGSARGDCCALYCTCMMKFCPATIPTACVDACVTAKTWDLVCRTYQCFASQNPNFPQDHDSHCKHAIGQLGKCGNR
jgi:hypothetical protein